MLFRKLTKLSSENRQGAFASLCVLDVNLLKATCSSKDLISKLLMRHNRKMLQEGSKVLIINFEKNYQKFNTIVKYNIATKKSNTSKYT